MMPRTGTEESPAFAVEGRRRRENVSRADAELRAQIRGRAGGFLGHVREALAERHPYRFAICAVALNARLTSRAR